jgi:osmotically-inducible protein OsmY
MGPRKSDAQLQADKDTVDRVQGALTADTMLYSRHITVRADDGVVSLGGYVWTQPELEDAVRVAQSVPGVIKVVDRMEIDRGAVSDSAVTR